MLKNFYLAVTLFWREWRAGEWFIIFFALVLAITATTSIHFYTDRLGRGLDDQKAKFLGGDMVISSPTPIPVEWHQKADALQMRSAEVWAFPSVASTRDQLQLVNLQAVSKEYPLVGKQQTKPALHTIWVEPRLLPLLKIALQGTLMIGSANFSVTRLLTNDVDALNTGWAIAPRVMIALEDIPATHTVLPGSRVDYRLLLVGTPAALQQFRLWITPQLNTSQRLLDVNNQQLAIKNILQQAQNYMQLILLASLLMSGVAIALAIQQYQRRHHAHVALWRCLGARFTQIKQILLFQLLIVALLAGSLGVLLGYGLQNVLLNLFQHFLQFSLPAAGFKPVILGFVTSIFLLFAFAYSVIDKLPRTPPLFLWRNSLPANTARNNFYVGGATVFIAIFICWGMNFSLLTLYFMAILLVCVSALYGLSLFLMAMLAKASNLTNGPLRRGLHQLIQYSDSVSLQFVGFNLILIALIVLGLVRTYLIDKWEDSLPAKTPNYFAFNMAPTDLEGVQQFFKLHSIRIEGIYPMVRGRLTALNGRAIMSAVPVAAQGNNALHRELNLSWMWQFPSDNKVVKGQNWTPRDAGKPWVSVENKLAQDLHLHLGDKLTFQVGAQSFSATILNFRTLDWSSFHPNFFMIFPPGLLTSFAETYITSFHLAEGQETQLNALVQAFPNITVIDVAALLQQMQDLIGKITLAMQYLFLFALGAGFLIFITSLQASMDERRKTYQLLRVLGAGKRYIRQSIMVEFTALALLILLSASSLGWLCVYVLERSFFTA
jgi:putative ABC transport system permease protein